MPTDVYDLRAGDDAPRYMRREFITTGYRVSFTPRLALASLFRVHNETGNIWTHLLGFAYFVWCHVHTRALLLRLGVPGGDRAVVHVFFLSAEACMACSAVYHLFLCMSAQAASNLLKLDVAGIALLILGSYLSGIYFAFSCSPICQAIYMGTVTALVAGATYRFELHATYHDVSGFAAVEVTACRPSASRVALGLTLTRTRTRTS